MKNLALLHFADLHVSEKERDYSMSILNEIINAASSCDAIVIAGDLFDSFSDMSALWKPVMGLFASYDRPVIYCAGNHEYLEKGKHSFSEFLPADNVFFVSEPGLSVISPDSLDTEFVVLPFYPGDSSFDAAAVPDFSGKKRVFVSHGTLGGMYEFFSNEDDFAVISPSVLEAVSADYAALGHIHSAFYQKKDGCVLCYPGSSRVWRKGESGKRSCMRVSLGTSVEVERVFLDEAGEWKELSVIAGADDIFSLADTDLSLSDYLTIRLDGIMDNMQAASEFKKKIEELFAGRVRKLDIDDNVDYLSKMSEYRIVKLFLKKMDDIKDKYDKDTWNRALLKGLLELKQELSQ
ncbi:metallophosphoesterase family protein [Spirochaetia bacterium 38H-sp]|uniref:Metallophosphoesterase family protein n=1 Tax=Rarispira pelagica TaxID=3141764 RepID=A0ABU9U8X8_9SPIR